MGRDTILYGVVEIEPLLVASAPGIDYRLLM
jgi:hypothetical protein